ncbi:hypothetical protein V9T40_007003 [Parthenolecanium corni]|uniref:Peptidase A2 domain-containing protein n=1 Tax=Parthenolecanium corni TaxID=536013 RepID=A0AAN9TU54_9HEMI
MTCAPICALLNAQLMDNLCMRKSQIFELMSFFNAHLKAAPSGLSVVNMSSNDILLMPFQKSDTEIKSVDDLEKLADKAEKIFKFEKEVITLKKQVHAVSFTKKEGNFRNESNNDPQTLRKEINDLKSTIGNSKKQVEKLSLNQGNSGGQKSNLACKYSRRLSIQDHDSQTWFLVDTGSDVSLIPAKNTEFSEEPARHLYAANSKPIKVFGEKLVEFNIGIRRSLRWIMQVTDVDTAILGADFLEHFDLSPDLKRKCLTDNETGIKVTGFVKMTPLPEVTTIKKENKWIIMIREFPCIELSSTEKKSKYKNEVTHVLDTPPNARPVKAGARMLTPEKLRAAKIAIYKMVADSKMRPSNSEWSSPIHMVTKSDLTWRVTDNFRALNAITRADNYQVPIIMDFNTVKPLSNGNLGTGENVR